MRRFDRLRGACRLSRRALLAAPALVAGRARAEALPPGSHRITFPEPSGTVPGPMAVFLHRPAAWAPDGPVVAVMHGLRRNADTYRDAWAPQAERHGFLVVCPEFAEAAFPGVRWYNFGNAVDEAGQAQPAAASSFAALDRAVDAARAACGATRPAYALYGHSAGAQFVHRALLLTGLPRAGRIVIANSGWYSMPRLDLAFPYGLGGTAATEAGLREALARPVTLLLGEADTDPNHRSLRRTPEANAQGPHRFARGQAFFAAAREAAERLGGGFAWQVRTVPGVGHSDPEMAVAAAPLLALG